MSDGGQLVTQPWLAKETEAGSHKLTSMTSINNVRRRPARDSTLTRTGDAEFETSWPPSHSLAH